MNRRLPLLALGLAAAAVVPGRATADAGPSASAIGVVISIPGGSTLSSTDPGVFEYRLHRRIVSISDWVPRTSTDDDARPNAHASVRVTGGVLFGGALTFASAVASADAKTAYGGSQSAGGDARVIGLVVRGTHVKAAPGARVDLGGWGYAVVDGESSSTAPVGAAATAVDVHLTSAHAGLPAGTEIIIGSVSSSAPPPPQSGGGGRGSGGTGGSGGGTGGSGGGTGSSGGGTGSSGGGTGGSGGGTGGSSGGTGGSSGAAGGSGSAPGGTGTGAGGSTGGSGGGKATTPPRHQASGFHRRAVHRRRMYPRRRPVAHPRLLGRTLADRIVSAAESQIGWPYVWGGESEQEDGFDCSGLVDYAFAAAGHALPGRPTAEVLWAMSTPIRRSALRRGDLVFLLDGHRYAYHVAIYAGDGRVVVAAHRGTVVQLVPLDSVPWSAYGRLLGTAARPMPAHYRNVPARGIARSRALVHRPLTAEAPAVETSAALSPSGIAPGHPRRRSPRRPAPQPRATPAVVARDEPLAQPALPRRRPPAG